MWVRLDKQSSRPRKAQLWSPRATSRRQQGVTFEHRYQTVLESSREIQHCPVRCPQRPRAPWPEDADGRVVPPAGSRPRGGRPACSPPPLSPEPRDGARTRPPTLGHSGRNPSSGPADPPLRASAAVPRSPHLAGVVQLLLGPWAGPGYLCILILDHSLEGLSAAAGSLSFWGPGRGSPKADFLLQSPTQKPLAGQGWGHVGGWRWGLHRARWAGGPVAVSRAPPSSLPGSIRDQTPSNAAQ